MSVVENRYKPLKYLRVFLRCSWFYYKPQSQMSLFGLLNVKYVSSLSKADSSRESHPIFSSKFLSDVMMSIFHLFKTLSSRVMFSFYHKVRKAYIFNKSCCYELFMVKVWFELWTVVKNASQSNQHLILFFTNSLFWIKYSALL